VIITPHMASWTWDSAKRAVDEECGGGCPGIEWRNAQKCREPWGLFLSKEGGE